VLEGGEMGFQWMGKSTIEPMAKIQWNMRGSGFHFPFNWRIFDHLPSLNLSPRWDSDRIILQVGISSQVLRKMPLIKNGSPPT
jgi:hypothetical protein